MRSGAGVLAGSGWGSGGVARPAVSGAADMVFCILTDGVAGSKTFFGLDCDGVSAWGVERLADGPRRTVWSSG